MGQALRESAPEIRSSFITKTASSLSSSSSSLLSSSTSSLVDDMCLPEIIAKVTAASPERRNKGIMGGFMGRRRALPMKKRKSFNLSSSDTSSVQDMEASDMRILELASKNAKRMSECELGVHNAIHHSKSINNSINNVNNSIRVQGQEKLLPQLNDVLIQGKNKSSSSSTLTNHIRFFKNGMPLGENGIAFDNVIPGTYHPAISCYLDGSAQMNFGPYFVYPPQGLPNQIILRPISDICSPPPPPEEAIEKIMVGEEGKKSFFTKKMDDNILSVFKELARLEVTARYFAYMKHLALHRAEIGALRKERGLSTGNQ